MFCRWKSTVFTDRNSFAAASRFVAPSATATATRYSADVSSPATSPAGVATSRSRPIRPVQPCTPRCVSSARTRSARARLSSRRPSRATCSACASRVSLASIGSVASSASAAARDEEIIVAAHRRTGAVEPGRRERTGVVRAGDRAQTTLGFVRTAGCDMRDDQLRHVQVRPAARRGRERGARPFEVAGVERDTPLDPGSCRSERASPPFAE